MRSLPDAVLTATEAEAQAQARQCELTKPPGSLGRLEDIAVWMAARQRRAVPRVQSATLIVFAADHGVAVRRVSAYPPCVTAQMVATMAAGRAAACVFAHTFGVAIQIVDVGVASDLGAIDGIVHANVRRGTADLSVEAAMTADEARRALAVGREQAALAIDDGADLLIAGEIGIANTTSSAAVVCALLNEEPACVVGRGTGVDGDGLEHKIRVVSAALARVREAAIVDPFAILANLGGLEIAAMAGVYLESARRGVPVILDGFISAAAAAVAVSMEPACRAWLLAGHLSAEVGHQRVLEWLQLKPILELGLRLGEGTGALLAWPIVRAALAMHAEMQTFDEAGVSGRS